jgi:hypothetical protein
VPGSRRQAVATGEIQLSVMVTRLLLTPRPRSDRTRALTPVVCRLSNPIEPFLPSLLQTSKFLKNPIQTARSVLLFLLYLQTLGSIIRDRTFALVDFVHSFIHPPETRPVSLARAASAPNQRIPRANAVKRRRLPNSRSGQLRSSANVRRQVQHHSVLFRVSFSSSSVSTSSWAWYATLATVTLTHPDIVNHRFRPDCG